MNNEVKSLYSCCKDNKVIVIATNLSEFVTLFNNVAEVKRSYNWYYRRFKEQDEFSNGAYNFQRLV